MKASDHRDVGAPQRMTKPAGSISQKNAALHSLLESLGILLCRLALAKFCSSRALLNATLPEFILRSDFSSDT